VRYHTHAFAEAADGTGWGVDTYKLPPAQQRIAHQLPRADGDLSVRHCAFWRAVLSTALSENWRDAAAAPVRAKVAPHNKNAVLRRRPVSRFGAAACWAPGMKNERGVACAVRLIGLS
jgi:hypothetical protein